ncbi:hypothetical protein [Methylohalobius crimeensis]|uniref:hypothetical protein n=1 Tax=Methylohalobius crimeensis TaxID=244365 RepID=UPI00042192A2|nr:hypothetical protein [Methylohalobius crimeensis]
MKMHHQYITDETGNRVSVVLPLDEYRELMERLEDLEDAVEAKAVLKRIEQGEEETVSWESIKAEHGL